MSKIGLYWHTLRYLKPVQFWYRVWFKLYKPAIPNTPVPPLRQTVGIWQTCHRPASFSPPNTFKFLNDEKVLEFPMAWEDSEVAPLWLYNLHYFDDLVAFDANTRAREHEELIQQWVTDNAHHRGIGWQPYPTSLRIVNWIKWSLCGNSLSSIAQESLSKQASYLEKRIEYHLQGNHLWANAKALLFAGIFFEGVEAERWLQKGLRLLLEQLDIQVLDDGGHFERSPMYHAIVLEDVIDLIQLGQVFQNVFDDSLSVLLRTKVNGMLAWLAAVSLPDNGVTFFNDSVAGIAPDFLSLSAYAAEFGCESKQGKSLVLEDTGYFRLENTCAIVVGDVGKIGPDFQPGHAHADTLSFEAALLGHRFIVNSGIDQYGESEKRLRQRGTAAHSTVEIDGENSSEVWAGFRVARRAEPFDLEYCLTEDVQVVECSHDGYRRLAGNPVHRRRWELGANSLKVIDAIEGKYSQAVARFYLHPEVTVSQVSNVGCHLRLPGVEVILGVEVGKVSVIETSYHPEFGLSIGNQCIQVEFAAPKCVSSFTWSLD